MLRQFDGLGKRCLFPSFLLRQQARQRSAAASAYCAPQWSAQAAKPSSQD